ncbi:MAG TPA: prephenate dehydrogenase dimerization domain-containing protein, partial [Solirubrobacterales bacterium]|nr:prephenate dehydrogenase dimerization domain-containing protein [Solirubrobacterales bacterium]
HRIISELGARPLATDAETHDRMMATVSHLPHVIANVLAAEATEALGDGSERLPEVGPSFRDTTRVAGANPAIWVDIFASNREALAEGIDAVVERLRRAAALLRADDAEGLAEWHREALADRRRLLEAELVGGPLCQLRVSVENRPGTVAEIALALGRAGLNIEDMALYPAADMRTGAVSLWVAGAQEAERAAQIVRELGYTVSMVASS